MIGQSEKHSYRHDGKHVVRIFRHRAVSFFPPPLAYNETNTPATQHDDRNLTLF